MKKMKRILAAGLMLLALAGCGTSDNQAAHEQEENRHGNRRTLLKAHEKHTNVGNSRPKRGGNRHSTRIQKRRGSNGPEV